MLNNYETWTPERVAKTVSENEELDYVGDNFDFLRNHLMMPLKQNRIDYDPYLEVAKLSMGFLTTYKPNYNRKWDNWETKRPEEDIAGAVFIKNEYLENPNKADLDENFPPYFDQMQNALNITDERLELFSK